MKLEASHYVAIAAIIIIALFLFLKLWSPRATTQRPAQLSKVYQIDATPDEPAPFGYKCTWLAVKTTATDQVAKELGLQKPQECNWRSGIQAAYSDGWIFVSPPVNGWTLVVGRDMPTIDGDDGRPKAESLMNKLSAAFGEVQHFSTHRVSEYHAWAKSISGKIEREFAYCADFDEPMIDSGKKTAAEISAGYSDGQDFHPNESTVMKVAGVWSLDSTQLSEKSAEKASGLVGKL